MPAESFTRRRMIGGMAAIAGLSAAPAWSQETALELMRQGGLLLFMRHANASGIGDPGNFQVDDCATQRNLSQAGRDQAVAVGATLRRNGVSWQSVQSSRWCRCLDTARLAFGAAEPFDLLNSSFAGRPDLTLALRTHLLALPRGGANRFYVTHMVNILRLLDVNAANAEIVLARTTGESLQTLGALRPPV